MNIILKKMYKKTDRTNPLFYERVNNKKLYKELKIYKKLYKRKREDTVIPDYIPYSFYILANKISYKKNYIDYTYIDDMISFGYMTCIKNVLKFDTRKSKNPYSYFYTTIDNAFKQFIIEEKKQSRIKDKLTQIKKNDINTGKKKNTNNYNNEDFADEN